MGDVNRLSYRLSSLGNDPETATQRLWALQQGRFSNSYCGGQTTFSVEYDAKNQTTGGFKLLFDFQEHDVSAKRFQDNEYLNQLGAQMLTAVFMGAATKYLEVQPRSDYRLNSIGSVLTRLRSAPEFVAAYDTLDAFGKELMQAHPLAALYIGQRKELPAHPGE